MKNLSKVLLTGFLGFCVTQNAFSLCKPLYVGAQIGGCNLHYEGSDFTHGSTNVKDKGFAARLLAGVDVNQNIGLELGYTDYQNPEFKFGNSKTDFSQTSLDLLAKITLPVSCNVGIYAKAGMAFVHRDDAEIVTNNFIVKINDADNHLRPMLGLGITYGFNSFVAGDLGYFRTFGTEDLEDADFYGAGITVRIG